MLRPLLLLLLLCAPWAALTGAAQCYATFRQEGIELYNRGQWARAKAQFKEAADCKSDKPAQNDLSSWIRKCDSELGEEAKRARQRREQESAQRQAEQTAAAEARAADDAYWDALKDGDVADCDKYLTRYEKKGGRHVSEARERKRQLLAAAQPQPATSPPTTTRPNTAYRDCPDCPLMMPVEGSSYTMGSPAGEEDRSNDECTHTETVASFSIGVYEVTVEEYLRFADATNSHYPEWLEKGNKHHVETGSSTYYKDKGYARSAGKLPVAGISHDDARAYCTWLSNKTGKNYRLPAEKEWEYAARGGKKTQGFRFAGSNNLDAVGWYSTNSDSRPHPVGGKAANELGLYDMSGNLWEWCQDAWAAYPGCTASTCSGCAVLRGGSWHSSDSGCRSVNRLKVTTSNRNYINGLRCARDGQ